MSTDCPPQLHLSIQPNTTSFKRSFDQFGFDLESPVASGAGAHAATSDGRGERNKRARSTISFDSETSSDVSSDTLASTSSSTSSSVSESGAIGTYPITEALPLPATDTPDVDMSEYSGGDHREVSREGRHNEGRYHLALQRFNEFDSEIAHLRQPSLPTTPPPTLPPLRHRLLPDDVAFFRQAPAASLPFPSDFFSENPLPGREPSSSQTPRDIVSVSEISNPTSFDLLFLEPPSLPPLSLPGANPPVSAHLSSPSSPASTSGFRDRLNTALERLRSPSPLVPGLDDSDPELRGDEDDMQDSEEEQASEVRRFEESSDLPPILPPIQTTDAVFHNPSSELQPPSVAQIASPDPPILPPIPSADSAWDSRGQLFDNFLGPDLEHSAPNLAPLPTSLDMRASPRPFSRSAGSSSASSSTPQAPMSSSSLVDHPLPSPILRDLHNWIEERQPVHNQAFTAADGASSTAAAAGTDASERDTTSPMISPSASVASSPTSDAAPTDAQHDRLSRMLDRIRTGARVEEWAGHSGRRPWPPHAAPWTSSSAETNILQDLLPWYHSNPTAPPASSSDIPNASPETSRPISTTPALNPSLSAGDNMTLDAFWEPLFSSITSTRAPRAQPLLSSTAGSEQQWHQRPEDSAVRSTDNRYGDRHSPSAAESNPRLFESFEAFVAAGRDMGAGSLNHWQMVAGEASGLSSEPADGMDSRDRQASDPIAGLWRPLEPTELPLHLHFSAASSTPNTPADINPYFSSNTAAHNDASQAPARPLYGSTLRHAFGTTHHSALTLEIPQQHNIGNSSSRPASLRREPRRLMERHEVIREMLDATESAAPARPPVTSSLSNWNGRSHGAASQTSGPPLISDASVAPGVASGGEYERVGSTAVDARRMDPRLRHRLVRSYSQNRPGSGTSLVAENTSEVRRQMDHAELRRMHTSMVESDSEEPSAGSSDSVEAAEAAWRWRRFTAAHREGTPGMARLFRHPNPVQPSNLSDLMDTSESTTPNGQNPDATTPSNQSYALEAPSLPPPDLGSSFTAGPQTRLATTSWASEHISADDAMETHPPTSTSTDTLFVVDGSNSRPNRSHSRFRPAPRMTTTAMPNVLRQLHERERQLQERDPPNELPRHHQMMMDERMSLARDRHQHYERTLQESRRLLASAARAAPLPTDSSASSERGLLPLPHSNGNFASILNPTTATSIASGLNVTRPPPTTEPRRGPPGDPTGRYTHFDPSTFAAGPFRNTLQHFANERDLARVDPYAARAYMRHPPPHIPPLSFDSEPEYSLSSPTRADSMAELRAARAAARAGRESREVDRGPAPHSRNTAQGDLEMAAEAARPTNFIVPSNDNIHNDDMNTARWLSEQQRSAIAERYRSQQRRMEAAARLDASSRHVHAHAREHVAPSTEDSINAMRMPPTMQRHRRAAQFLDDDEVGGESFTTIGTRNPRRMMRGNSIMLSRTVPNAAAMAWRRGRPMGDFVRDEDFDSSYESLLSLGMQIGDVKPRATPSEVLSKMQKGVYSDFAGEGTDTRCPICLDDYEPTDPIQKLNNCSHWLHEGCLGQWLQTANTCPVCRESVTAPRSSPFGGRTPRFRAMPFNLQPRRRRDSSPTAPITQPPAPTASTLRAPRLPASRRHTIFEDPDDVAGTDSQESNGRISNQGSPDRANFAPWRFHHP